MNKDTVDDLTNQLTPEELMHIEVDHLLLELKLHEKTAVKEHHYEEIMALLVNMGLAGTVTVKSLNATAAPVTLVKSANFGGGH